MALEAQDSVRALGVNWSGVGYELSFFALFMLLMARHVRRIRLALVRIEWSLFGRMLLSVFVASLGASLIFLDGPHVIWALIRVVIFAMVIVQTWVTVRVITALRRRPR